MKQALSALALALLVLIFAVDDAEARRLGGGRSLGMQRSTISPSRSAQTTAPSQAAAPAAAPAAAGAATPGGSRWLGPIAGLAAGLGLGWLLGHGGLGGLGGVLMMLLLGMGVFLVIRALARPRDTGNLQYAGAGEQPASAAPPSLAPGIGAGPALSGQAQPNIPPGFDTEGFLHQAKLNFVKLQKVHDSGKLGELREFTTDAMFESIKRDLLQHGAIAQQTDVVTLDAELLEALTEGDTHWASVRFSGMIRESADAQPEAFEEVWNLAKPVSGRSGWLLAGIQQLQ